MEKNYIELTFKKTLSGLAGNPFGQSIYDQQVSPKMQIDKLNVIVFPEHIEDVAISFIQGFFKKLMNEYGIERLRGMVDIEARDDFVVSKIWENIY